MRIAWFSIPAYGHTNPTIGVVKELVSRGHEIYYYGFNQFQDVIEGAGAHFGVDEQEAVKVMVYPNPTRYSVTIEAEGIERLRMTNMMGQVLNVRECDGSDSVVLNLSGYTPSVYLLEVKTINGVAKKRLVLYR